MCPAAAMAMPDGPDDPGPGENVSEATQSIA